MEEVKTLERIIEQYEECKRNCEEFTVNSTALYREEYEAIENLINKYKEQEKQINLTEKVQQNYKNAFYEKSIENTKLRDKIAEQEKMINMMAVSINVYDSQLVINTFKDKEDVKDYFRKKAKGE